MKKFALLILPLLLFAACQTPVEEPEPVEDVVTENSFDVESAEIGDTVVGMTINSVEPFSTREDLLPINTFNAIVEFSGEAELTGTYHHYPAGTFIGGGELTCFDQLDETSISKLPRIDGKTLTWFCFRNLDLANDSFDAETGETTIIIDNFQINSFPSEVWNLADLLEVVSQ